MKACKKYLALALVLCLSLSLAAAGLSVPGGAAFDDMPNPPLGIARLSLLGVVKGDTNGNLNPGDTLQRQEMATLLYRLVSGDIVRAAWPTDSQVFEDVDAASWASGFITAGVERELIQGVGENRFQPESTLSNYQLSALLTRALGYGYLTYPTATNDMAQSLGLWSGTGVSLTAESPITRQQAMLAMDHALTAEMVTATGAGESATFEKNGRRLLDGFCRLATGHTVTKQSDGRVLTQTGSGSVTLTCLPQEDFAAGSRADYYYLDSNGNARPDDSETIVYFAALTAPAVAPTYENRLPGSGVGLLKYVGMASVDGESVALYDVCLAGRIYRSVPGAQEGDNVLTQWAALSTNPGYTIHEGEAMLGKINVDNSGRIAEFFSLMDTDYNPETGAYPLPRWENQTVTEFSDRGDGQLYRATLDSGEILIVQADAAVYRTDKQGGDYGKTIEQPLSVSQLSNYLDESFSFYDRDEDGIVDIVLVLVP